MLENGWHIKINYPASTFYQPDPRNMPTRADFLIGYGDVTRPDTRSGPRSLFHPHERAFPLVRE